MTIKVATEFTRSGSFAIWESGSFNPQTDNGWACLVADPMALPQRPVFERNVAKSKHHYLFRVVLGALVVVTNIQRMPNSRNLFSARVTVGKVTALHTQPSEKNPSHLDAESQVTPLWSESFLAPKADLLKVSETLVVSSPALVGDCLESVYRMIRESLDKALTPATEQRMFWGEARETKPKKAHARGENPTMVTYDELGYSTGPETGRVSSNQQQDILADATTDTTAETEVVSITAEQQGEVPESSPRKLTAKKAVVFPSGRELGQRIGEVEVIGGTRVVAQGPAGDVEEHDGSISMDSMSLCGLSTDPLPPLQAT